MAFLQRYGDSLVSFTTKLPPRARTFDDGHWICFDIGGRTSRFGSKFSRRVEESNERRNLKWGASRALTASSSGLSRVHVLSNHSEKKGTLLVSKKETTGLEHPQQDLRPKKPIVTHIGVSLENEPTTYPLCFLVNELPHKERGATKALPLVSNIAQQMPVLVALAQR
jgi:hypothetical protein